MYVYFKAEIKVEIRDLKLDTGHPTVFDLLIFLYPISICPIIIKKQDKKIQYI